VYYFTIDNVETKNTPLFLRTGLKQQDQCSGLFLYWKFERGNDIISKPGPQKGASDGSCELLTLQKISFLD